jgi:hypothetical protein
MTLPSHPFFREAYKSVQKARQGIGYFNTTLQSETAGPIRYEDLVGFNVKCFPEYPDYARMFFSKLHAMQRMGKGMGKVGGLGETENPLLFNGWAKLEGLGESFTHGVHNGFNYHRRITNPAGTVIASLHPQVDFDWWVGMCLICGFLYGDGVSIFDAASRFGVDPSKMYRLNDPSAPGNDQVELVAWQPDQPGTPAPVSADGYPIGPHRWHDAAYEAAHFYSNFKRTEGVGWGALAYRFKGTENFIEPPEDGASVLEHASAFDSVNAEGQNVRRGRPVVEGRFKNSALDFVAFDTSRSKMYSEEIFVRAPNGQQFPSIVRGCIPNPHNETINN